MSADLTDVDTEDLVQELTRRQALPPCPCGRRQTYMGAYDRDGYTLRCHGCRRAIGRCTCGR